MITFSKFLERYPERNFNSMPNAYQPSASSLQFSRDIEYAKEKIKNKLKKALEHVKRQEYDYAASLIEQLTDPNTGEFTKIQNNLVKDALLQWLEQYKSGFYNYLLPILTNAVNLTSNL